MGVTSGRKLHEILRNVKYCLAIEFLCNTQAVDLLSPLKTNAALNEVYELIRKHVPPINEDRVFSKDIENITKLVNNFEILDVVESKIGKLH